MGGGVSTPGGVAPPSAPSAPAPPGPDPSPGTGSGGSGGGAGVGGGGPRLSPAQRLRAATAKRQIEVYYRDLHNTHMERLARAARLEQRGVTDDEARRVLRAAARREVEARKSGFSVEDFDFVRKIGQGSYGEVFLVRDKASGTLFALKRMRKDGVLVGRCVGNVWLERFVLATCGGRDFVCKMIGTFQDLGYLYFLCEYLPGGDLLSMLIREDRLSEDTAKFYIAEIVIALNALHRTGVIHRDVKPDNVIFGSNGHVRLADFGLSKSLLHVPPPGIVAGGPVDLEPGFSATPSSNANAHIGPNESGMLSAVPPRPLEGVLTPEYLDHVRMGAGARVHLPLPRRNAAWRAVARLAVFSTVGTPNYIAPEVVQQRGYAESVDWWSVGCILYEMLVGFPPFWAEDVNATYAMILRAEDHLMFPHESGDGVPRTMSFAAEDLIRKLLVCDPGWRLGTKRGLNEFREHPFFEGVDWDKIGSQRPPFEPHLTSDTDTRYFDEEVTSQQIPPPESVPPSDSPSGSAGGGGDGDGGVFNDGQWSGNRLGKYDEADEASSFPSSSVSRVTVAASGRDGSDRSSATSGTASGNASARPRGEKVSSTGIGGLIDDASVLGDGDSTSRKRSPKRSPKRTCRVNYTNRCQDPEFVGFTFISPVKPKRQRLTPGLYVPPEASPPSAADPIVDPIVEGATAVPDLPADSDGGASPVVVAPEGVKAALTVPEIAAAGAGTSPLRTSQDAIGVHACSSGSIPPLGHSHSQTPGRERSRFAPAQQSTVVDPVAIAAAIASAGASSSAFVAEQQLRPGRQISTGSSSMAQRGPVLDGGSDAEDDDLFDGSSSSSDSLSTDLSGSEGYEQVDGNAAGAVEERSDDFVKSVRLQDPIDADGAESESVDSEEGSKTNPAVSSATLHVRDDFSQSAPSSIAVDDEGNDGELEAFVDEQEACIEEHEDSFEACKDSCKDSAEPADAYKRGDLVRLFSAALNMPVDEGEDRAREVDAPVHALPSGLASPALSRQRTPSHSRQASVQLPNFTPGHSRQPSVQVVPIFSPGHSRQPSLQKKPSFPPVHVMQSAVPPRTSSPGHSRQPSVQLPNFTPSRNQQSASPGALSGPPGPSALPAHVRHHVLPVPNATPDHRRQLSLQVPLAGQGHSRQASVQLPHSPLASSSSLVIPPWTDRPRTDIGPLPSASSTAGIPGGSSGRFPTSRPTHAKRTDACQQSLYNISSTPSSVAGEGSLDEREFLSVGLYNGANAPNQALHALEVAAALGEAAATNSRQASPITTQEPAAALPEEVPGVSPLAFEGLPACVLPGRISLSPSRRLSGGNPGFPLSPLAISVTPPSFSRASSIARSPLAREPPITAESFAHLSQVAKPEAAAPPRRNNVEPEAGVSSSSRGLDHAKRDSESSRRK